jgi:hypothetical protein
MCGRSPSKLACRPPFAKRPRTTRAPDPLGITEPVLGSLRNGYFSTEFMGRHRLLGNLDRSIFARAQIPDSWFSLSCEMEVQEHYFVK